MNSQYFIFSSNSNFSCVVVGTKLCFCLYLETHQLGQCQAA